MSRLILAELSYFFLGIILKTSQGQKLAALDRIKKPHEGRLFHYSTFSTFSWSENELTWTDSEPFSSGQFTLSWFQSQTKALMFLPRKNKKWSFRRANVVRARVGCQYKLLIGHCLWIRIEFPILVRGSDKWAARPLRQGAFKSDRPCSAVLRKFKYWKEKTKIWSRLCHKMPRRASALRNYVSQTLPPPKHLKLRRIFILFFFGPIMVKVKFFAWIWASPLVFKTWLKVFKKLKRKALVNQLKKILESRKIWQ